MNPNDYIAVNEWNYVEPFYAPHPVTTEDADSEANSRFDVENLAEINSYSEGQPLSPKCRLFEMQMC